MAISPFTIVILATLAAIFGAVIGLGFAELNRRRLEVLVHLATGALLGITAFDILPEAKHALSWSVFVSTAIFGYAFLWAIGKYVFTVCPSCAISHLDESSAMARKGSLILVCIALGIHCVLDGLAVTTASHTTIQVGLSVWLGIGLHKLPEGMAFGLLLVGAGYSKRTSVLIASGVELLTIAGGAAGLVISTSPTPAMIGVIFALVGGGFIYLVFSALEGALTHPRHLPRLGVILTEMAGFAMAGAIVLEAARL